MPGWTPPPDLHFPHLAAAEAIAEASVTLHTLGALLDHERVAGRRALDTWAGGAREAAAAGLAAHDRALLEAVEALRNLLVELDDTVTAARAEQRRRDELQLAWRLECAAEAAASGSRR